MKGRVAAGATRRTLGAASVQRSSAGIERPDGFREGDVAGLRRAAEDQKEGTRDFVEKREAKFTNRSNSSPSWAYIADPRRGTHSSAPALRD